MMKRRVIGLLAAAGMAYSCGMQAPALSQERPSSAILIEKAWSSHGARDTENTLKFTQQVIDLYKDEADTLQANLSALPKHKDEIEAVQVLNDVATAYFIQAEMYMRQQDKEKAIAIFKLIIEKYQYAQAWDQRGWFWSMAEASQQSIKKLESGSIELEPKPFAKGPATKIVLYDTGKEDFVEYARYGEFQNVGTNEYKYVIADQEGLSAAVGEGIYPNTTSLRWDPEYKKAQKEKRLGVFAKDEEWDFLYTPDLQAAFFKWALAPQPQAVRLFYEGLILEKAGLIKHAIKCYYAIIVHFPGSYGITYFRTPWYVGQAAISRIDVLLRRNPQIGYRLEGADIRIVNGFDKDVSNDIVSANPGKFVKVKMLDQLKSKPNRDLLSVKTRSGKGRVQVLQYETGDWELQVDNKPYCIRGITYVASRVGESPDEGTLQNWIDQDLNKNGRADGPYDAFIDKNKNNRQDKDEPAVGDFALMKEMGVNTIRLYHHPMKVNKDVLRDLYKNYGIMTIMGDFLGKYTLGSGAQWNPGTDYNNEEHRKNMMDSVLAMVNEHKDEPYVLFWILGNENVYGYACNADKDPDAFFKFANEVAKKIKEIDPDHPVAICSGDILFLDRFGKYAPDVDIFGTNAYRGNLGFGYLWRQVKDAADKPVFITEYGCSAYYEGKSEDEGEYFQADYHQGSWEDITHNSAFSVGAGNALGGVAFEWLDEWWKGYEPSLHDKKSLWKGPFPDGTMHEEWLGLCGQGDGKMSPFLRQMRKAYYTYKKLWR
jgi:beta-glucuronidase